ncbi:hypothetical protein ACX0MU_10325 [Rhizorhabdus wittichii]
MDGGASRQKMSRNRGFPVSREMTLDWGEPNSDRLKKIALIE